MVDGTSASVPDRGTAGYFTLLNDHDDGPTCSATVLLTPQGSEGRDRAHALRGSDTLASARASACAYQGSSSSAVARRRWTSASRCRERRCSVRPSPACA